MTQPPESNPTRRPVADGLLAVAVFVVALLVRIVNLGVFLTSDEPRAWLGWSIEYIQGVLDGRFGDIIFSFSPGVTLLWSGSLGLLLDYLAHPGTAATYREFLQTLPFDPINPEVIFWFRLPVVIAGALCIALMYLLARQLLGQSIALTGSLLLALDPLMIGMTRVLGHDGLAAAFMAVSALAAIVYYTRQWDEHPAWRYLALSAIFGGLALITKLTSAFLLPFIGLVALATFIHYKRWRQTGAYLRDGLIWLAVAGITIFALWPALWTQPVTTLQIVFSWLGKVAGQPHNRGSFFLGQPVPDPGMAYYWVAAPLRLTAVTSIGLLLALAYLLAGKPRNLSPHLPNRKLIILLMSLFILFFIIFLGTSEKKQDRYLTPMLPMVAFTAAAGYGWIAQRIKSARWQAAALAGVVAAQALIALSSAPYYLTHY
ncbi:MAG: phospholipid carrier-dependent glycosyltransferase, partial [Chloroflexi bacterium]